MPQPSKQRAPSTLLIAAAVGLITASDPATGDVKPDGAALFFDFSRGLSDLAESAGRLKLKHGATVDGDGFLTFTSARQSAVLDDTGIRAMSRSLRGARSLSIGGWFYSTRSGEQGIVLRGPGSAATDPSLWRA